MVPFYRSRPLFQILIIYANVHRKWKWKSYFWLRSWHDCSLILIFVIYDDWWLMIDADADTYANVMVMLMLMLRRWGDEEMTRSADQQINRWIYEQMKRWADADAEADGTRLMLLLMLTLMIMLMLMLEKMSRWAYQQISWCCCWADEQMSIWAALGADELLSWWA